MIAAERETCVAFTDADEDVHIYTCRRQDITAMRKKPQFTEVRSGRYGDGTEWATFSIPRSEFSIARAAKVRRNLTDEQRQELAQRLHDSRRDGAV